MIDSFKHSGLQKFYETHSKAGIIPTHAKILKLDEAFGTTQGLWYKLRTNNHPAQARRKKRTTIKPLFNKAA